MTLKTSLLITIAIAIITAFFWIIHFFFMGVVFNLLQIAFIFYVGTSNIGLKNKESKPIINTKAIDP